MGKLVADADVFCLLSEYEAHPVAVMEALGAGTKALVADTSGLSELGRAGLATTIALEATARASRGRGARCRGGAADGAAGPSQLGRLRRTVTTAFTGRWRHEGPAARPVPAPDARR